MNGKTSLTMMLAQISAEASQYNAEKGIAADAFTQPYNDQAKLHDTRPLGFVFAFDLPADSASFVSLLNQAGELTTIGDTHVPILHILPLQEYYGHKFNMVFVALPADAAGEMVGTRVQALATSHSGRLVYTKGTPSLHAEEDFTPPWGHFKPKDFE